MHIKTISEAMANLSYLIKMVQETNEPVSIGKAGKPIAVLPAYKQDESSRRLGGSWEGKVKVSDDFDDIDKDITDSFYNTAIFPDQKKN
ncbi:type II toxin-antitoxin system Phd/YefM family antitoxin [Desulfobacter curvatus]|uniref:type II toxin-antitoxin system Phd/YefM family antitoxin n=1 Tax=Desulfobacter curvatus TaxID=2290 RepID=UPI0003698115|nr:type II toxin-antitoxin system Phd/YefM family antitoxin [Desulfobacter curvatus]